jgi:hypothetical protein
MMMGMNPMNIWGQKQEVMHVTDSLRKISKELLEINQDTPDFAIKMEGASWLISYIADCLDVEMKHAAERGRKLAEENRNKPPGPNGVKDYKIISGDDI